MLLIQALAPNCLIAFAKLPSQDVLWGGSLEQLF